MENENLKTVAHRIGDAVTAFWATKVASEDPTFTANQLRFYVMNLIGNISPGSADRVLRQLRFDMKVDYIVLNRGRSIYQAIPVRPVAPTK